MDQLGVNLRNLRIFKSRSRGVLGSLPGRMVEFTNLTATELTVLAAGVVASSRLALDAGARGEDPEEAFATYVHTFTAGLETHLS